MPSKESTFVSQRSNISEQDSSCTNNACNSTESSRDMGYVVTEESSEQSDAVKQQFSDKADVKDSQDTAQNSEYSVDIVSEKDGTKIDKEGAKINKQETQELVAEISRKFEQERTPGSGLSLMRLFNSVAGMYNTYGKGKR